MLAFATSYWFWSVVRAVLLWFPLFVGIGFAGRRTPTLAWRVVGALAAIVAVGVGWRGLWRTSPGCGRAEGVRRPGGSLAELVAV